MHRDSNIATLTSGLCLVNGRAWFGGDRGRALVVVSIALLVSLVVLGSNLGGRGSLDGHEVLVAQTAKEMLASGDWVHPTFGGAPRYQKPPLAYWLTATAYEVTGTIGEWSARLPSAVSGIVLVCVMSFVGMQWFGFRVGVWSGVIQATSLWSIGYGKSALVDMTLSLIVAAAILMPASDRLLRGRVSSKGMVLGFWFLLSLAVLAKGPVGLLFVLPTVLIYRIDRAGCARLTGDVAFVRSWWQAAGALLFVLLSCVWPVMILWERPEVYWLWHDQSVGRFVSHFGPQTRPWYYYLYQAPLLTLPWTPFWLFALVEKLRDYFGAGRNVEANHVRSSPESRLLWMWFGVAVLVLSLSAGKREHYLLPGLAPLSIVAALYADRVVRSMLDRAGCRGMGSSLALKPGISRWLWDLDRPRLLYAIALIGFLAVIVSAEYLLVPHFDKWRGARALVERHFALVEEAEVVVSFGSNDHAPIFFVQRPMRWTSDPEELRRIASGLDDALVLIDRKATEHAAVGLEYEEIDRCDRFVLARPLSMAGAGERNH